MIYWDRVKHFDRTDSPSKRPKYWVVCDECGVGRWLKKGDVQKIGPAHWCSKCGPHLAHWKGGRRNRPDGYVRVVVPTSHPNPSEFHRGVPYMLEHRLVMEGAMGRYLGRSEVVHHINGNPADNRIENLELYASQSQHIAEGHVTNA